MKIREPILECILPFKADTSTNQFLKTFNNSANQEVSKLDALDFHLTAEEFASLNLVKPQSVRARLCRTGSYFGIRPKKLLNGRLAFPNVQVTR